MLFANLAPRFGAAFRLLWVNFEFGANLVPEDAKRNRPDMFSVWPAVSLVGPEGFEPPTQGL